MKRARDDMERVARVICFKRAVGRINEITMI